MNNTKKGLVFGGFFLIGIWVLISANEEQYPPSPDASRERKVRLTCIGLTILGLDLVAVLLFFSKPKLEWKMPPLAMTMASTAKEVY